MTEWLTDWLINWLTVDLLPDWLTDWDTVDLLPDRLIDWLTVDWLPDWLTLDLLPDWLIDWVTVDFLPDWLIDWVTDWLILTHSLTHWPTNWTTFSLTDCTLTPFIIIFVISRRIRWHTRTKKVISRMSKVWPGCNLYMKVVLRFPSIKALTSLEEHNFAPSNQRFTTMCYLRRSPLEKKLTWVYLCLFPCLCLCFHHPLWSSYFKKNQTKKLPKQFTDTAIKVTHNVITTAQYHFRVYLRNGRGEVGLVCMLDLEDTPPRPPRVNNPGLGNTGTWNERQVTWSQHYSTDIKGQHNLLKTHKSSYKSHVNTMEPIKKKHEYCLIL